MIGNAGASSPKAMSNEGRDKRSLSLSPVSRQHDLGTDGVVSHSDGAMSRNDGAMIHSDGTMSRDDHLQEEVCPQWAPPCGPLTSVAEDSGEDMDSSPDSTRKRGGEFDDHEVWNSPTSGTPSHKVPTSSDDTPIASPQVYQLVSSQPTASNITHQLHHQQSPSNATQRLASEQTSYKHPRPVRKVRVIPELPKVLSPPHSIASTDSDAASSATGGSQSTALPPPSALVAKLFPSLQNERAAHRAKGADSQNKPHPSKPHPPPNTSTGKATITQQPSKQGDTATYLDGLDEQVRVKLVQLEEEIKRFKAENGKLEKLRLEREEVSQLIFS